MDESQILALTKINQFSYLDCCADFYQEVINIKCAYANGRLEAYLGLSTESGPVAPADIAKHMSARLEIRLRQQNKDFMRSGAVTEKQVHKTCLYLMAALVDEIFILEAPWKDSNISDAWLDVLLENKLFKTSNAGTQFFTIVQKVIKSSKCTPLRGQLAVVLLMFLDLGFKGMYRGLQGQASLKKMRLKLYQIVRQSFPHDLPVDPKKSASPRSNFSQAYSYLLANGKDERLAPISPWKVVSVYALAGYLLLSATCWVVLMHPFLKYIGS